MGICKIAVVGANSFLGRNLTEKLTKKSFDLFLLARNRPMDVKEFEFAAFDYPDSSLPFNKLLQAEVIIYAAGAGIQSDLKESSELVYQLNAFIPISLLVFLHENNFQGKVITFGSYFEIGMFAEMRPYSEEELIGINTNVSNHYCSSKRLLTRFLGNGVLNLKQYHFILPTIYGPGENQNRLIPYVIRNLVQELPMSLTSGDQFRSYLYVNDLSDLIIDFIERDYKAGIYNIPAAEKFKIKDLVNKVSNCLNKKVIQSDQEIKRYDTSMKHLELNCEKLSSVTDWKPFSMVEDAIPKYNSHKLNV